MSSQFVPQKPEIMSPAGYWPQLRAAIEAGADSVYFGLKHFTARAKVGFTLSELPEVMRTLHARGVKGFVTFNSLIFEHELEEAARAFHAIAEAGADAVIIQDLGMVRLARQIAPELELHGSTQMSITDADGVRFAQELGVHRVTLARELSLAEVRAIRAETDCELEIFVHGALCVAYSGQCFSSEAWGGRSANRGQCAQACRLPYDMIVDGAREPLGDARYLLSPGDLYALHHIPEIVGIGISALKIEGRYKDADYVALTTSAYRKAVDEAWAGRPLSLSADEEIRLEQVYSRGLGDHFIGGTNHQKVVNGRAPRHRGVLMGRVVRVSPEAISVAPADADGIAPLKPGDGVVFDSADWRSPEEPEEGGRVYGVTRGRHGSVELRFANRAIAPDRLRPGDLVWRTHDPGLDKVVRTFTEPAAPVHKQAVRVSGRLREGEPVELTWMLTERPAVRVEVRSERPAGKAESRAATSEYLREQLGRLGNTPYELTELSVAVEGQPFVPASVLNQLRRAAVDKLAARQGETSPRVLREPQQVLAGFSPSHAPANPADPCVHLLVRTPEQLDAAIALRPGSITLDYLDLYGLKPSVTRVKDAGIEARVASPRVLKPGEDRVVQFLLKLNCPILVRSTGLVQTLAGKQGIRLTGDFSLNAANRVTARLLLAAGLERITPTHDLNAAQVAELARESGGERLEAVAYQHLPVFHTEHCVFCRFLSEGTTYKDCGRPCESRRVELRDSTGRAHPVMADVGCRNTVFGAEAQEASAHLESWLNSGIRHFRLEFVHESGNDVTRITRAFEEALGGRISPRELGSRWKQMSRQGTTQGSLFVPPGFATLPVLQ